MAARVVAVISSSVATVVSSSVITTTVITAITIVSSVTAGRAGSSRHFGVYIDGRDKIKGFEVG
jgi:hypothetical protein